jgi:UPF0271 protein
MRIDLNADLGEGVGDDEALLGLVTSANIATGAHAGGGRVLDAAVAGAVSRGVAVGAHPSYRDRAGFGRASGLADLRGSRRRQDAFVADLVAQVLEVGHAAERHGARLAHIKAHGSLYNESVVDALAAGVVAQAVAHVSRRFGYPVAVLSQPGGALDDAARAAGLPLVAEGFVDRAYAATGWLVPRDQPGAILADIPSMVVQARDLAGGRVRAASGHTIAVKVDSLCLHGDSPGAVAAATAVRGALEAAGWNIAAPERPA